jgi:ATP/maltotriose-dependent transcriptional regulator MalT
VSGRAIGIAAGMKIPMEDVATAIACFLLQTFILDRLTGPLCDAVTGEESGKTMLEALEHGNLFVMALDDKRRRYRYHQLCADVLQARASERVVCAARSSVRCHPPRSRCA